MWIDASKLCIVEIQSCGAHATNEWMKMEEKTQIERTPAMHQRMRINNQYCIWNNATNNSIEIVAVVVASILFLPKDTICILKWFRTFQHFTYAFIQIEIFFLLITIFVIILLFHSIPFRSILFAVNHTLWTQTKCYLQTTKKYEKNAWKNGIKVFTDFQFILMLVFSRSLYFFVCRCLFFSRIWLKWKH